MNHFRIKLLAGRQVTRPIRFRTVGGRANLFQRVRVSGLFKPDPLFPPVPGTKPNVIMTVEYQTFDERFDKIVADLPAEFRFLTSTSPFSLTLKSNWDGEVSLLVDAHRVSTASRHAGRQVVRT